MKHFGYESYSRWFVRIFFCKFYSKFKCAVFKRCVMWTVIENTQIWITQIHLTVKFAVALKKNPFTAWCFLRMLLSLSLFLYVKFGRKTPWLGFRKIPQGVFPTERFDRTVSKLSKWSISMLSWLDLDLQGTCVAPEVILQHFQVRPLQYIMCRGIIFAWESRGPSSYLGANWALQLVTKICWEKIHVKMEYRVNTNFIADFAVFCGMYEGLFYWNETALWRAESVTRFEPDTSWFGSKDIPLHKRVWPKSAEE